MYARKRNMKKKKRQTLLPVRMTVLKLKLEAGMMAFLLLFFPFISTFNELAL